MNKKNTLGIMAGILISLSLIFILTFSSNAIAAKNQQLLFIILQT